MMRSVVHAVLCGFALFAAGIITYKSLFRSHPIDLDLWMVAPSLLGAVGLTICAVLCFKLRDPRRTVPLWLLLPPALCLAEGAVVALVSRGQLIESLKFAAEHGLHETLVSHSARLLFVQGQSYLWATASLFGALLAAGCWGPEVQVVWTRSLRLRSPLFIGFALAVVFLLGIPISKTIVVCLAEGDEISLRSWIWTVTQSPPGLVGWMTAASLLFILGAAIAKPWKQLHSLVDPTLSHGSRTALGFAAVAVSGVGICFALAGLTIIADLAIDRGYFGEFWDGPIDLFAPNYERVYFANRVVLQSFAIAALALGLCALVPERRSIRLWWGPLGLVAASLMIAMVATWRLGQDAVAAIGDEDGCSNLPQITALIGRQQLPHPFVIGFNPIGLREDDRLRLPATSSEGPLQDAVLISIKTNRLEIDDNLVVELEHGRIVGKRSAENPLVISELSSKLVQRVDHLRQMVHLAGGEFRGKALLAADKETPYVTLFSVIKTAQLAGFDRLLLIAREAQEEAGHSWTGFHRKCPRYVTLEVGGLYE